MNDEGTCVICGDRATGKHYGAISCDGCKGFFRRSIRKRQEYVCRYNGDCVVDKDHRNTCRKCRLAQCLSKGMRKEHVQHERDSINHTPDTPPTTLERLVQAEAAVRSLRSSVITRTSDAARKEATTGDVTDSMHQQLILMVEWAKKVDDFTQLDMQTQVCLLRNFAAQHLVLCAAYRSMHLQDALWLTNDTCLHKNTPKVPDVNRVAARIVDQLTKSMRKLQTTNTEYVALKGIAFFDPLANGIQDHEQVDATRQKLLKCLEVHLMSREQPSVTRLSNLLLVLPPLLAVSRDLVEDVQLAKLFGLADIDHLMTELLLPQDATKQAHPVLP